MTDRGGPGERAGATSFRVRAASWSAYACAWGVFVIGEIVRAPDDSPGGIARWLLTADADTLVYLFWLLAAPCAWSLGRSPRGPWWRDRLERAAAGMRGPAGRGI